MSEKRIIKFRATKEFIMSLDPIARNLSTPPFSSINWIDLNTKTLKKGASVAANRTGRNGISEYIQRTNLTNRSALVRTGNMTTRQNPGNYRVPLCRIGHGLLEQIMRLFEFIGNLEEVCDRLTKVSLEYKE